MRVGLVGAGTVSGAHADAYAAFRETYNDLDDGRAAARAVDALLG